MSENKKALKSNFFIHITILKFLIILGLFLNCQNTSHSLAPNINQYELSLIRKMIDDVNEEFTNTKLKLIDAEDRELLNHIEIQVINLLKIIYILIEKKEINPFLNPEEGPFVFLPLAADPPTWGHITLCLMGIINTRSNKSFMVTAKYLKHKPDASSGDVRFQLIDKVQDILSPLIMSYKIEGLNVSENGAGNHLGIVEKYQTKYPVYYIAGDEYLTEVPDRIIKYSENHNINLGKIHVLIIQRNIPYSELEQQVKAVRELFPKLGGVEILQDVNENISSTGYKVGEFYFSPHSVDVLFKELTSVPEKRAA